MKVHRSQNATRILLLYGEHCNILIIFSTRGYNCKEAPTLSMCLSNLLRKPKLNIKTVLLFTHPVAAITRIEPWIVLTNFCSRILELIDKETRPGSKVFSLGSFEVLNFKSLKFWSFDVLKFWSFDVLKFWSFEVLKFWSFVEVLLKFWRFEVWSFDILKFWSLKVLKSLSLPVFLILDLREAYIPNLSLKACLKPFGLD